MTNPYCFNGQNFRIDFKNNLDSHNINHANSILAIIPIYTGFGIETRYIKKICKEMATIYARLISHYKFKYHFLFSASIYKTNEEDQRSNELEIFNNLVLIKS